MGAPQYEQAGADVAGSGTPGTIPVWSSGTTLTNSGITDNGSTVTFNARNLASSAAQTWTLANSTAALNIGNNIFIINQTSGRVLMQTTDNRTNSVLQVRESVLAWAPNSTTTSDCGAVDTNFFNNGAAPTYAGALARYYPSGVTGTIGGVAGNPTAAEAAFFLGQNASSVNLGANGSVPINVINANGTLVTITIAGNVHAKSGTTTMTDGFFYIPAAAGAPTGTPTAIAGRVPMYYDTTNNEFYIYNTAWKKVALL